MTISYFRHCLSTRLFNLALLAVVGLLIVDPALAQPSRAGTGEVIAVRVLELKPGVDVAAFERFVTETYNPAWEGTVPGVKGYIAKADRGARKGSYALIYLFDSEKTRDAISPTEGGDVSEAFLPFLEPPLALNQELLTYVEPRSLEVYNDYVVLR